jgi:lipopolysaccharide export system protein LptC
MVNSLEAAARERQSVPGRDRAEAFRAASIHSRRVRRLRTLIIVGCALTAAGLVIRAFYDPFSKLPGNLSLAGSTLNGTRVTMERPKLNGYRRDGRPYDVRATSGVQDIRQPNIIELNDLEAKFETVSRTVVRVAAHRGVYDSGKDSIHMMDDIRVVNAQSYDIRMKDAEVDFKNGNIVSREPVSVVMASATITANALTVIDNGEQIVFEGEVRSMFHSSTDGERAGEPKP